MNPSLRISLAAAAFIGAAALSVLSFAACDEIPSENGGNVVEVPAVDPLTPAGNCIWSDEFEGDAVLSEKWTFETGNNNGWGNNELQFYRAENSALLPIPGEDARALVITAKKESWGLYSYTSSRLKTQTKASFRYGRIETRIKFPEGKGTFPAFWMMGETISSVGWPRCGEIDIAEMIGGSTSPNSDYMVHGTTHWYDNSHQYIGDSQTLTSKLSEGFHIYTVDWTPEEIVWSVDGSEYNRFSITEAARSEFHGDFFILLNFAIGGNWGGPPDTETIFPQTMWIDWVRVYPYTAP
jgi:beta-glucanase (GH16 family)